MQGQRWTLRPMQARDLHCSNAIGDGRRAAWISLPIFVGLMAHASILPAQAGRGSSHVIAPLEQAALDNDRVELLRHELRKSQEQLENLVRRKAERLAAQDMEAVTEAEEQRVRTLGDIASLKREIASASAVAGPSEAGKPSSLQAARRRRVSDETTAPAPWWDVYRSGRHNELSASSDSPAPEQGARRAPARPTGVAP